MKIVNEALLDEFRRKRRCEWCGRPCPDGADPHHYWFTRGHCRLDVAYNLFSMCRECHTDAHNGLLPRDALVVLVAEREGVSIDAVIRTLNRIRRLPKGSNPRVPVQARPARPRRGRPLGVPGEDSRPRKGGQTVEDQSGWQGF